MIENTQSKMSQANWRIPSVDGLRAMAMLMVYAIHMYAFTNTPRLIISLFGYRVDICRVFEQFPSGVDLFMVLSGFCLFLPACKSEAAMQKWHWQDFYKRRARRIVPPYYAAILYSIALPYVLVILYRLLHQPAHWPPLEPLGVYLTFLLFAQTLFLSAFGHINGALWSMGLEAQFYLLFPLVIWGYRRFGLWMIAAMIAVSIIYRIIASAIMAPMSENAQFLASVFFLGRWMQFALGMTAAWIVVRYRQSGRERSAAWGTGLALGAVTLFSITCATTPTLHWLRSLLLGVAFSGLTVALCISTTPMRALFENRYMTWLGYISYSLFLLHWPTGYYLSEFCKKVLHIKGLTELYLLLTVGFGVTVGISYLFFLLAEKPFLSKSSKSVRPVATASHEDPVQDAAVP